MLLKVNRFFPLVLLSIYFLCGIYLIGFFQYQINADGEALIAIAKAIKAGDLYHSINAYWGILSPLILFPFLYFEKVQPVLIFKISNLIIGAFGLIGFYRIAAKYTSINYIRKTISILVIPLFIYFAFFVLSSDLLILTLLIYYLDLVFDKSFGANRKKIFLAGVLGGLLVMTKEYFLYFFILHFGMITITNFFIVRNKKAKQAYLKSVFTGLAVFLVISFSWAGLLTIKYHTFMFGSKGSVNLKTFSPKMGEYPMFTQGLIPLPNPYGLSAWDDPTLLKIEDWNPLASWENILYIKNLVFKNSIELFRVYHSYSLLLIPLLTISFAYLYTKKSWGEILKTERILLYTLATILVYPIGYVVLYTEARYIWPNYVLAILAATYLICKVKVNILRFAILIIILLTFIKTPVSFLKNYQNMDHTFYDQSKILGGQYGITGKSIASNSNWHQTLYICTYLNCKYYGMVKRTASYGDNIAELKSSGINYYLSWDDDPKIESFRKDFKEIEIPEISNLRLFKIN